MGAEIASPSLAFLVLACLVYPLAESGILVFFIWALGAMKASSWLTRIVAGIVFGLMHTSFGLGKVVITAYAGIVYSSLFLRAGGGIAAFLQLSALHAANNLFVIGGVALIAGFHAGR